jgi:hypothetical protein
MSAERKLLPTVIRLAIVLAPLVVARDHVLHYAADIIVDDDAAGRPRSGR